MSNEETKECLTHLEWLAEDIQKYLSIGYLADLDLCRQALEKQIQIEETLGKGDMFYIIPQGNTWTVNGIDVQEALEKQVPKKPRKYIDLYKTEKNGCPCCERNQILYAGQKYCSVCGQAIDWSDNNDN